MFIHAMLVVLQILEPHRTAVGCTHKQGDVKGVRETYVEVDDELVKQGVPKRLPKLTPLDSYRMQLEIVKYAKKVADQPDLLLKRTCWRAVFTTQKFRWWCMYNDHIHTKGHGVSARGERTMRDASDEVVVDENGKPVRLQPFWHATKESLLEEAPKYVNNIHFAKMVKLFCDGYVHGVRTNDLGWFDKLDPGWDSDGGGGEEPVATPTPAARGRGRGRGRAGSGGRGRGGRGRGAKRKGAELAAPAAHPDVRAAVLEEIAAFEAMVGALAISPSESLLGQFKHMRKRIAGMRLDAAAGQAAAQSNDTWGDDEFDELAEACLRTVSRRWRKKVKESLDMTAEKAAEYKMNAREAKRVAALGKQRLEWSRAFVEHQTTLPSLKEWDEFMDSTEKGNVGKKQDLMKQCYATVVLGWGHKEYECNKSGDGHCNLCNMPLSTGWTIGGHMQV